jgi:hypothetical protein
VRQKKGFAYNDIIVSGGSSVSESGYPCRGSNIPTPPSGSPKPANNLKLTTAETRGAHRLGGVTCRAREAICGNNRRQHGPLRPHVYLTHDPTGKTTGTSKATSRAT